MPIDFNCPSCQKLLRVPDEAAGRQAKCPQCGNVIVVPGASAASPTSAGMPPQIPPPPQPPFPSSGPLMTDDEEFRIAPPTPPPSYKPAANNPFASPANVGVNPNQPEIEEGERNGPPWERNGASVSSFIETVKEMFTTPNDFFSNMRREGGFGMPLGYAVVGTMIGNFFGTLYAVAQNLLLSKAVPAQRGAENPFEMGAMSIGVVIVLFVLTPVFTAIGFFVWSGINHLLLMMVDGARQPFETTARVYGYVAGSCALLMVIPCVGSYAVLITNIVYMIIGLSKAHEISMGKAAAAVLIPFAVICGCAALGTAFFIATVAQHAR